jgi:uncharacterized membrane protein
MRFEKTLSSGIDWHAINTDTWLLWLLAFVAAACLLACAIKFVRKVILPSIEKAKACMRSVRANFPPP